MSKADKFARAIRDALGPWAEQHGFTSASRAGDLPCFRRVPALLVREAVPGFVEQIHFTARRASRVNPTNTHEIAPTVAVRVQAVEDPLDAYFSSIDPHYLEGNGRVHPLEMTVAATMGELLPHSRVRRIADLQTAGDLGGRIQRELDEAGLPWLESHRALAPVLSTLQAMRVPSINALHRRLVLAQQLGNLEDERLEVRIAADRMGPLADSLEGLVDHLRQG
ncbi:MAG: hypothetical protein ACE37F_32485 [Nannocystaceae bacterium]|nr:hypothetical protein [bacterium]